MSIGAKKLWTVGGGKGGVGKSFLTASMAAVIARAGKPVVAVDADLGSSNLHTFLGIKSPGRTLLDLLEGRAAADEVLIPTQVPNLRLLSCAGDIFGIADPTSSQKQELLDFITGLEAEYVLVDIGAGTSARVLDFFNLSDEGIIVVSPDPASMQSAYAFIKSSVFRRVQASLGDDPAVAAALRDFRPDTNSGEPRTMMDFYASLCTTDPGTAERISALVDSCRPLVMVNMACSPEEQRVAEILQTVSKRFMNVNLRFCGLINSDPAVRRAVQRMELLDFGEGVDGAAAQIRQTVLRLTTSGSATTRGGASPPVTPVMGLNDSLQFLGKELHIQTEDLGFTGRCIATQVFFKGRVIHSRKSEYPSSARGDDDRTVVVDLMRRQHFEVIRELESRKCGAGLSG
jgi:flagellar biosynthesis protein FlhG